MKNNTLKTTILLSVIVASITTVFLVVNTTQTSANQTIPNVVDFSAFVNEDPIIIKKGETRIIPVEIKGLVENTLDVKIGVVKEEAIDEFEGTGTEKLPDGISASFGRKSIQILAGKESGLATRDTVLLTLSTSKDIKPGDYTLWIILHKDLGDGQSVNSGDPLRIQVQE
jgi:hypothetical protein